MLSKSNLWRALTILALLALLVTPFSPSGRALASQSQQGEGPAENGAGVKPLVSSAAYSDTSPALRDIKSVEAAPGSTREVPFRVLPKAIGKGMKAERAKPALVQNRPVEPNMPAPIANFEGVGNNDGVLPPDTNGDIGVDPGTGTKYYMQWNNLSFQIWDVTNPAAPVSLYGPVTGNTLFSGFGGPCQTTNHGDPIVLFDHLANRWLASQFSINGPFYQCIAISQTADPTGAWYRYAFLYSSSLMNDYPKFGVWPDGYYMTANQFNGSTFAWEGGGVVAFERDAMLVGNPAARMVYFDLGAVTLNYGGMLPADLDGPPPPDGTPNFFAEWDDSSWLGDPEDTLRIWEFDVDWANTANSTFGLNAIYDANYEIPTSEVDPNMCDYGRNCIPQPGGSAVDAISDRLMHRLQYRNFGTYQALVTNHTVDADGSDRAGVHWLELRNSGSGWDLYQDGVYAPAGAHRWMGSAALDANGNLALGYSVSSTSVYPSIRYTGRLVSDPPNTLPQGEAELIAGTGYQEHSSGRWGDYSMMGVDPVDQCTFWYTQEYYEDVGGAPWQTRIGSFKYPSCTLGPTGTLQGSVLDSTSGLPIEGVKISLDGGLVTYSDAAGFYQLTNIPVGSYFVTASKFGYVSQTYSGVDIEEDNTTVQNFVLDPAAMVTVEGTVTDGSGHPGMPLYARLDVSGYPSTPLFSDPASGYYNLELPEGETFTFTVNAMSPGYNPEVRDVTPAPGGSVEDFALTVDETACNAPGYEQQGYLETFDSGDLPTGWSAVDHTGDGGWAFNDPGGWGNRTGGSGLFAIVDSDYYGPGAYQDAELISPVLDFSGLSSVSLEFDTDFNWYSGGLNETVDVDVSHDGGVSWTNVWTKSGGDYPGPAHEVINITTLAAGQPDVVARFHYYDANWEFWWQVDNAFFGSCETIPGGMLVGNAYDQNTGVALNEVLVASDGAPDSTMTSATPEDPSLDDGFYMLFSTLTGKQSFTASMNEYGAQTEMPTVLADETVRQDFNLPAGILGVGPESFTVTLGQNQTAEHILTLSNNGAQEVNFQLLEVNLPPVTYEPDGPFAKAGRHLGPKRLNDRDSRGIQIYNPPAADPLEAGDVIDTWSTGLVYPWGIGFNTLADDLWVGDLLLAGGDGFNHRYLTDGTSTGDSIDTAPWVGAWGADMTYNPLTGMLWQVNVGGDNCIYEMDPLAKIPTGNKICPAFPTSERGLAFDPLSNTFYSGSWNDWVIYHFDANGTMLDSVDVGLDISGLAFNPMSGSLFVMTNSEVGYDVYVLDVNDNYNVVGGFDIDGLGDFEQAGLEIDCSGTLWAVNQTTQNVVAATSGESGVCAWESIPWLTEAPESGTVAAGDGQDVTLTFDAAGLAPGTYEAHLRVVEDTPYEAPVVPVTLIVKEPEADLAVSLAGLPDPVEPGELLTYTVSVVNAGSSTASTLMVDMTLPAAVTLISVTPSQGSCSALPCNLGSLASGDDATVTVVVEVKESATGNLTATAQVSATTTDPNPGNNSDTVIVSVVGEADLGLSLIATPDPVKPGEQLTYTVSVVNAGPSTASTLMVDMTLPAAVTLISVTPSQGSCSALPCNLGSLASGDDATVTVIVEVKESATGNLTATAQVSATTSDPDMSNNSDTVIVSVGDVFFQLFLPLVQRAGGD